MPKILYWQIPRQFQTLQFSIKVPKINLILVAVFILALILRFLYYPNNIYFGIDQARDAFVSREILKGDFKIQGPPTSVPGLFHGPLYYYIFAPIYYIFGGNPEAVSAFLRIINSLGVFIVFYIGVSIFNRKTGLIASFLYALSFEQTQFAIYINHPSLAVIAVLIFYLGLSMFFFKNRKAGFIIAATGLALSLQFELAESYLLFTFILLIIIFRKKLRLLDKKTVIISSLSFLTIISSFIITEIKFRFTSVHVLTSSFFANPENVSYFKNLGFINLRSISDNLVSFEQLVPILIFLLLTGAAIFFYKGKYNLEIIFLLIWFFSGNIPYYKDTSILPLYYHIAGSTVALLVLVALLLNELLNYSKLFLLLLLIPVVSNLKLITTINPAGSIPAINVQSGMLLSDQKKVLDYVYQKSNGQNFSVYGLTMPLYINMTWAYLFQWYGAQKYGYLPVWGGENAPGYYGNLKVETAKSKLPRTRFFIIEPTRGIPGYFIEGFRTEENIFTYLVEEKKFGEITVQLRQPK